MTIFVGTASWTDPTLIASRRFYPAGCTSASLAHRRHDFLRQLAMMLRDLPQGTVADLNDCMVAYWNGYSVAFAFLCERGTGAVDEEFDLDDYVWEDWRPAFESWVADPVFSSRPEVKQWLMDAPPHEAGV